MKLLVLLITTFLSASTFEINGVDITINEGVSAKANGHLINNGSLSNYGIIDFNDVITNNGTIQLNQGTTVFSGENQSIPTTDYGKIIIDNSGTKLLTGNISLTDSLIITSGILDLNSFEISVSENVYLYENNDNRVIGEGLIVARPTLNASINTNIQGLGFGIITNENIGETIIKRYHIPFQVFDKHSISKYFELIPDNPISMSAFIYYHYNENDLLDHDESALSLYYSIDAGGTWIKKYGNLDTLNNVISFNTSSLSGLWTASSFELSSQSIIATNTIEINLDEIMFTETISYNIELANLGNTTLEVNVEEIANPLVDFSSTEISINPADTVNLTVDVNGGVESQLVDELIVLNTNDPDHPQLQIPISAILVPNSKPVITSIADVPDDQGGWVIVDFTRSYYDTDSLRSVEIYTIEYNNGNGWVFNNSSVAYGNVSYQGIASTIQDSSSSTEGLLQFRVIAGMEEGNYSSDIISGYSVDNIHPTAPSLMSAQHEDMDVSFNWQYELEEDFAYHSITSLNSTDNTISNEYSFYVNEHDEHWVNTFDTHGNYSDNTESIMSVILSSGPNLRSFNVLPEDNSIENVMASIEGIATGVIGQGVAASYSEDNGWEGSLTTIEANSGYWIIMSEDDVLLLIGEPTPRDMYNLEEGANLVSYPYRYATPIDEAIPEDIGCDISGIIGAGVAASCTESGWEGSLLSLEGSFGYWFIAEEATEITFNGCDENCDGLTRSTQPAKLEGYEFAQSTSQAFYFIEDIENIEMGDWILAYNADKVIGARQWQGSLIDVPAMGNDGSDYTKGYIETGGVPTFKILRGDELINLEGDIPSWDNNQLYMVSSLTEAVPLPETFILNKAYPNPFNPTTTLSFAIPVDSEVTLSIYNMQGRLVSTLIEGNMKAGYHSVQWNADNNASGVYFVKMVAGDFVNTQKLMLVK